PVRKKTARKPRPDEDTAADADAPATYAGAGKSRRMVYVLGGSLALLAVAALPAAFFWTKRHRAKPDGPPLTPPVQEEQPPINHAPNGRPPAEGQGQKGQTGPQGQGQRETAAGRPAEMARPGPVGREDRPGRAAARDRQAVRASAQRRRAVRGPRLTRRRG